MADSLAEILNNSSAWIHFDADTNRPIVYLNDADGKRFYVKKVQIFDETTQKLTTRWINLGEAPAKKQADLDPAVVQATKELIAEGKLSPIN